MGAKARARVREEGLRIVLTPAELREVAGFAVACASVVLPLFEAALPDDSRPRRAIEAAQAFASGGPRTHGLRTLAMDAYRAGAADDAVAREAARAACHAAGAAFLHPLAKATQVRHILGSAACALRAVELASPEGNAAAQGFFEAWVNGAGPGLRRVLGRYPLLSGQTAAVDPWMSRLDRALRADR